MILIDRRFIEFDVPTSFLFRIFVALTSEIKYEIFMKELISTIHNFQIQFKSSRGSYIHQRELSLFIANKI